MLTADNLKELFKTIFLMDLAYLNTQMDMFIKAIGKMGLSMDKE